MNPRIKYWREKSARFFNEELNFKLDKWQEDACAAFDDPTKQRISLQACAGPGKSALLAGFALHFLSTRGAVGNHPKGAAVSITGDNLKYNLWPEISKWQQRSEFLKHAFTWNSERIYANDHPETWFISARSFSKTANAEEQGKALAGLHSDYVLDLIDESGAIPLTVLKTAEQSLSKCKWGKIIQAGNPISRDGALYSASIDKRWFVIRITGDPDDPKRSPRIDIEWAKSQIDTYGRDNPWVKAYILGEFPPGSLNALFADEDVEKAMESLHMPDKYEYSQKRLGVDVAREGDDRTILFPRQGLQSFPFIEMRNARGNEVAARIAVAKERWDWETCFVDDTGGWGGSVQDSLLQGGLSHVPVNFAGKADDPRYLNKRAEMWFRAAEWVKRGGKLPSSVEMKKELTTATYTFVNGKFQIEPKEQIKKRLGFSPDIADAFILTFAWPDMPRSAPDGLDWKHSGKNGRMLSDWDPIGVESDARSIR